MEDQRVNKLKIIKNPTKKSGKDLMNDLKKPGYAVSVEQIGQVIVRIDKKSVPMSLNDKVVMKDVSVKAEDLIDETEDIAREIANHPLFPKFNKNNTTRLSLIRKHFSDLYYWGGTDNSELELILKLAKTIYEKEVEDK